ncbi:hypothetical protein [Sulfuricurvum sp.]|uniref:hypothetical protein n=1 Tax=Sulfuricurvum sp. TaxID=2025608 RepID=UPI003BAFF5DB
MGEEYKAINREKFPGWQGWKIIDDYLKIDVSDDLRNRMCENNAELQELVAQFHQGGKE